MRPMRSLLLDVAFCVGLFLAGTGLLVGALLVAVR